MATDNARYYTGVVCGTGANITVPAVSRHNRTITRLVSCLRVTLVEGTPNSFSCVAQTILGNGYPGAGIIGAGEVLLRSGVLNRIDFGTPLAAGEFVVFGFESDDTGLAAV